MVARANPLITLAARTPAPFRSALEGRQVTAQTERLDAGTRNVNAASDAAEQATRRLAEVESIARGANEIFPDLKKAVLARDAGNEDALLQATNSIRLRLNNRIQSVESTGGIASDSREALELLDSGDLNTLVSEVSRARQLGDLMRLTAAGGSNAVQTMTAGQKNFQTLQALGGPDTPEGQQFMEVLRRQSEFGLVGGVPSTINPGQNTSSPLNTETGPATLEGEVGAAQNIASGQEQGRIDAQVASAGDTTRVAADRAAAEAEARASVISAQDRTDAKNKLPRVDAAGRRLENVNKALTDLQDNQLFTTGPGIGRLTAFTKEGNALEVANAQLLAEMTALTRVKGVGAQSDFEQRLQQMVLPSLQNFSENNSVASGEVELFIADLRTAISNVAEGTDNPLPSSFLPDNGGGGAAPDDQLTPGAEARQQAIDAGVDFFFNPDTNSVEPVNGNP